MITNLYGTEREEAVAAMEDDDRFDRWMIDFQRKQQRKMKESNKPARGQISNDDYMNRFAKVHE